MGLAGALPQNLATGRVSFGATFLLAAVYLGRGHEARKKTMKKQLTIVAVAALTAFGPVQAGNADPGFVDFGKFSPSGGSEFVEVNVNSNLIAMVTNFAKKQEPQIAEVLGGLKSIRVNVLGVNDENREEIAKRIKSVRAQLDSAGWERLVTVMKGEEDVGVFMKTRGPEAVEGIVVTVLKGNEQAVFVNIVGDIRPDKLATVGERFNIEPLKHLPAAPKKDEEKSE